MRMGATTRIRLSLCPHCGAELEAASLVDSDDATRPGDVTVCLMCVTPLQYNPDLSLRLCEVDELDLETLRRVAKLTALIDEFHKTPKWKSRRVTRSTPA
jgi:hypothetical protein